jgi:hypothetical protein
VNEVNVKSRNCKRSRRDVSPDVSLKCHLKLFNIFRVESA